MRIIKYSFMIMIVVIATLGAESFIQKKVPIKKQPRIKQEDVIAVNGDILKETTQLLKELALVQEMRLNDIDEIVQQPKNNSFSSKSQQDLQQYVHCATKIQNAVHECAVTIRNEQALLKKRCALNQSI